VKDAHAAGVKVLVSLGGWGWDKQFTALVSNPDAEKRYITSVMSIIEAFDYDGGGANSFL
jgi:chitinase